MINPFFKNVGPFEIQKLLENSGIINNENFKKDKIFNVSDLVNATNKDLTFFHSKKYSSIGFDVSIPQNYASHLGFTDDEYKACYKDLQTYCSAKQIKADKCDDADAFERHLFRSFFLIMANTMMRNGELYGLTWENVEQYEEDKKFALISVWADTSKTRKGAPFVARGYEHFERLKRLSRHTKKTDYVFTDWNGKRWHAKNRRRLDNQFHALMSRVGITDYMERNLKIYSLRHYGITKRIENGVTNMLQFASDNRTSAKQIENTYFHSTIKQSYKNAKLMNKKKE